MKTLLKHLTVAVLVCAALLSNLCAFANVRPLTAGTPPGPLHASGGAAPVDDKQQTRSAAYEWLDVALEATAREHERVAPRPTVGSRMLAILGTCMYDAWAAYDEKAVGTRLGGKLRRPAAERTEANKAK